MGILQFLKGLVRAVCRAVIWGWLALVCWLLISVCWMVASSWWKAMFA